MTRSEALAQDHTVTTIRGARVNLDRPLKGSWSGTMMHSGDDLQESTLLQPGCKGILRFWNIFTS